MQQENHHSMYKADEEHKCDVPTACGDGKETVLPTYCDVLVNVPSHTEERQESKAMKRLRVGVLVMVLMTELIVQILSASLVPYFPR